MITLNLNPELEQKIQEKANLQSLSIEEYIQDLIIEKINPVSHEFPLKGSVIHYEDPFEPAVSPDDWDVLS